jgi:hypothetical protein
MERTFLNQANQRHCIIGLLALTTAFTAQAPAQNAAGSANNAKNLARLNCGARITWISSHGTQSLNVSGQGGPATNLLLDDNTLSCELTKGDNTFLIALPNISDFDRFTFINERPEFTGTVQLFVSNYRLSPNDANWAQVGRKMTFGKERFVNISLTGMEGKYVKILFQADKAGTIAGIGLYGQRTLAAFADQQHRAKVVAAKIAYTALEPSSQNNLNFNFANLYSRARVVWVSSGSKDLASRMIDDDPTTGFEFSPNDPHPTVIIELSGDERLRRVSAVYETERGRLDIYLLSELRDPGILDNLKPVATIADNAGAGKAAAEFEPHGARYVALRWTPAAYRHGRDRFEIAEVGAFSDATPTIFDLQGMPELANSATVLSVPKEPPVLVPTSP